MTTIVEQFTEMFSAAGVQRAGRHMAAVAAKFASERGFGCSFLSLNDPSGLHTLRVGPYEFSVSGHARDEFRFVIASLRAAGCQPLLVIARHPHLAFVVSLMRLRSREIRSWVAPPVKSIP